MSIRHHCVRTRASLVAQLVKSRPAIQETLVQFLDREKEYPLQYFWASLVVQLVNNLPEMWETWVQSLGWEDSLGEYMATHSRFLPGESP